MVIIPLKQIKIRGESMIQSRKINIIVAIAVVFALITSILLVAIGNMYNKNGGIKTEPEYATKIFGSDIISIEIIAEEDDWQEMLVNAMSEQYIMVDVVVNGSKFENVGIRPKGNSSLTQVAGSDSDRYSFRIQFDEYIKGQTCFGLDSLVINNMIGDNTYMKEYVSYDLMKEIGVAAPYFGFADIKVNGNAWGLYLAVETYGDSYEERTFGTTIGMMYNVKSMEMGGGDQGGQPQLNLGAKTTSSATTEAHVQNENRLMERPNGVRPLNRGPMGRRGSNGGSLEYATDDVSSYSAIFSNVVGKGTENDFKRVIKALKALSEGKDLETYFEVDKILRYLAAHTTVVNLDSYSSSMAQNYYLYENNGKVTVLPWDYNLAWGGFQSGNASSVINFPIDTPVSGVEMSSRPLINQLLTNPEYREKYHTYLQELMTNYFADGKWEAKIEQLDALISDYVQNDQTAFCTFEEYKTAVETFKTLGNLRYQSIQGQLNGSIPSTTEEQSANPEKLISAGDLRLSSLGSMMGGGPGERRVRSNSKSNSTESEVFNPMQVGNMPDPEIMTQVMQIMEEAGGTQLPLPFRDQRSQDINTTQSLLIYLGLFAFLLLSTFLVAKKKRTY
ncbi:MAG: Spore coat protein CotH [Defluviitaleaceae bacterium]|jgi:spore coat protein CotH|uniref:Spore coat protein CotH n=2 Tax=Defluviitalea raffinosedens TaxID=1450156 RepID=A0A7C8LGR1_9FIRM|nr:spore coat protein CotH [Defluviitalea raffinosedens]MBZ4667083.1 Spore coat protein CotH [Defluviitaleaceae bacterium]